MDGVDPTGTIRANLDKDPQEIAAMFDQVAARYDLMNALASGGMDHVWLQALRTAVGAQPNMRILDLAAGTGASSAALASSGAEITACDLSEGMLDVGRRRHPEIEFVQGDATQLPFADASFDAVTIAYGLRNIIDPQLALREMLRVTKPGGKLVVCEFSTPPHKLWRTLYRTHQRWVMPLLAKSLSSDGAAYDYLVESIDSWPDQRTIARIISRNGWENVAYKNLTGGIVALHRGIRPHN